ncbi:renalase isoform X1 [Gossypium hirsutum]|uniref:Uncharacterized protein LOC107916104 isoform X1 n=3 Tax=Gossypium TaxID=3633 RepID=A0A1U8KE16_GOSHI|nr:renalase isoform X1 [Gossypium hirsutum]XP_016700756.1 renalase isoform X1 [Gossypium hirsutum]
MQNTVAKVAVVGSGISGSVCAATLARNGISVTLFDSARGPGGRMSQRREISEDGRELLFDHGAPYFTVTNPDVLSVVTEWESRGLVAEWKSNFGSFDCFTNKIVNTEHQVLVTIIILFVLHFFLLHLMVLLFVYLHGFILIIS